MAARVGKLEVKFPWGPRDLYSLNPKGFARREGASETEPVRGILLHFADNPGNRFRADSVARQILTDLELIRIVKIEDMEVATASA